MPAISGKTLEKRFKDGSVKVVDIKGWTASERKKNAGKLPAKDIQLLSKLLRTYDAGLKHAAQGRAKLVLREASMRRGFSALELRAANVDFSDDGWPVDDIPNSLDLTKEIKIDNRNGTAFRVGGVGVANMLANVRRIMNADGKAGLEINTEFRPKLGHAVTKKMLAAGATFEDFEERWGVADHNGRINFFDLKKSNSSSGGYYSSYSSSAHADVSRSMVLRGDGWEVHYFPEEIAEQAMRGSIRLRAFGADQAEQRENLAAAIKAIGAGELLKTSTAKDQRIFAKMRLLWQASPKESAKLSKAATLTEAKLDTALKKAKVPPEAIKGVRYSEVFPGYFTTVSPALAERYKARGVEAVVHSTDKSDHALKIILSGGLLATTERLARGLLVAGMSSDEDLDTGGADYAFGRLLLDTHRHKTQVSSIGGFVFLIKPEILARTDWFGYQGDSYGSTTADDRGKPSDAMLKVMYPELTSKTARAEKWRDERPYDSNAGDFVARPTGGQLLDDIRDDNYSYGLDNEVMFRTGIPLRDIDQVVTSSKQKRTELLKKLTEAGVKKINGKKIEEFVQERKFLLERDGDDSSDGYYV